MEGAGTKRAADEERMDPHSSKKQRISTNNRNGHRPRYHHNQNKTFGKPRGPQANGQPALDPLGELKNGLAYLCSGQFSKEATYHAQELQKIIFGYKDDNAQTATPVTTADNAGGKDSTLNDAVIFTDGKVKAVIDHTNVPNPFASMQSGSGITTQQPLSEASKYGSIPANNGSAPPIANRQAGGLPLLPSIKDLALMHAPFTHASSLPAYVPRTNNNCYEPLEFLGDAYIEVIATRLIHKRFPDFTVGQWANLREFLVRNDTLNQFSKAYKFDTRVMTTKHEKGSEKLWSKIVADVFEAYVAAVILSDPQKGFDTAENWLQELWAPKIEEWLQDGGGKNALTEGVNPDAKQDLQKLLVSKGCKLEYIEEKPMELIKDGNITRFFLGVYYSGFGHERLHLGSGIGKSKVLAGLEAAKNALAKNMPQIRAIHSLKLAFDAENKKSVKGTARGSLR